MNGLLKEVVTHVRDYDYETVFGSACSSEEFPKVYEIPREDTGTLKDQGNVGACVAEVICSIAEVLWERELNEYRLEMSEGFSYASLRDESLNVPGLVIGKAMKLWCELGTLPKRYFDKLLEMPDIRAIVNAFPEFYEVAKKYRLSGYVSLNYALNEKRDNAIKTALFNNQYGLVAGSNNYFNGGAHCIQLVGWNDERDTYIFKNSWGKDFGDNGFSEIPKGEVDSVYLPMLEGFTLPFSDVSEDSWYYKFVKNMYFSGLMKGTSPDTFEPDRPITRAEACALCYNIIKAVDERFDILNKVLD